MRSHDAYSSYQQIDIYAIVTIDCVGSAGVRRAISELVIYVDWVALAMSCSPINNSNIRDPVVRSANLSHFT